MRISKPKIDCKDPWDLADPWLTQSSSVFTLYQFTVVTLIISCWPDALLGSYKWLWAKKNGKRNYNVINVICLVGQIFQNRKCKDKLIKGARVMKILESTDWNISRALPAQKSSKALLFCLQIIGCILEPGRLISGWKIKRHLLCCCSSNILDTNSFSGWKAMAISSLVFFFHSGKK